MQDMKIDRRQIVSKHVWIIHWLQQQRLFGITFHRSHYPIGPISGNVYSNQVQTNT